MVRIKHRYLLINVLYPQEDKPKTANPSKSEEPLPWTIQFRRPSSDRFDGKLLHRMVKDGVSELFGDYGAGMIAGSLQVKYCSAATSTAIIRVARAHYRMVWAALSFVTKLPKPVDQPCVIQVVRVSGTIKKSEEEAVRRARLVILRAQREKSGGVNSALLSGGSKNDGGMEAWGMAGGIEDRDEDGEDEDEG
ncbi:Putative RNase P subunit Pop5/Rpp14/Rnp2 [Septoria linicola]|uniref:Ribonuclease P/MRP protein subunit POP5 n=1 Tax=Septoria linicola TaxID=215465 RepID=A0A9Q9AWZ8_9PEZI|nr:Putative RNase P subunit Pop5/Rpp14/Rnp2 [Septoria linicola]